MKKIKYWLFLLKYAKKTLKRYSFNFLNKRYFFDVEFVNPHKIYVSESSNIEKGTVIISSEPTTDSQKDIIINENCWIGRNVEIQTWFGSQIKIDDYASVQDRCKLLGSVSIGKYSILAPDIFISSGNHFFKKQPYLTIREQDATEIFDGESFLKISKPVIIGEDCWIGKNVFIKPGITIGRGSIIGTNSIVNETVEPYSIIAGNPAKQIKERFSFVPPSILTPFNLEMLPYFYQGFQHFERGKKIEELLKINEGILSENQSIITLENREWTTIQMEGNAIENGSLSIFINGQYFSTKQIEKGKFNWAIQKDFQELEKINREDLIPECIKKYFCISFEFQSSQKGKFNFSISRIELI